MRLFLGIDLGTSYFKVGLFDERGTLRGLGRVAVKSSCPSPGRAELAVGEFWRRLQTGLAQALAEADAKAGDIAALSYSSQANTFLLLDSANAPLTPLIFWTDRRAAPLERTLAEFAGTGAFRDAIGFGGISAEFAPAKWRWFQREEPEVWRRVSRVMTISDYLTLALTGERVGDAGTAALLGLYHLCERTWWDPALTAFGVDATRLSLPLSPGSFAGRTTPGGAALLDLPIGIPFAVGGLDHHVAAIGAGIGRWGDVGISTGTVLAAVALVDEIEPRRGSFHGPHVMGDRYYRLRFDSAGAQQLEDYRRRHLPDSRIEDLLALAEKIPPGATAAAGTNANRSLDHASAVRALLESMAAAHRKLVHDLSGADGARRVVVSGGGARSALWLQIQADMLGLPMVASAGEAACLGAAMFAAVAAGTYGRVADASEAMVHPFRVYEPDAETVAIYRQWRERRAES